MTAAAVASPSALPLRPSLRGLHSSPLWRAMRNVTGNTAHSRNAPPRPGMATTPTPTPQFAHAQPGAPQLSRMQPPPPPTGGRGAALHPAFAAPGSSTRLGRVLRVLFVLWWAHVAWTVYGMRAPEMSEEQQRRLQLERAQKRAARWRSPQDDLFIRHNLDRVNVHFDKVQRTLLERHAITQKPLPFDGLLTISVLEVGIKARLVAQCNRMIESRPLPPGASEPKENEWSE